MMRKKNLLFKIIPFLLVRIRSKVVRIRNTGFKASKAYFYEEHLAMFGAKLFSLFKTMVTFSAGISKYDLK